MGSGDSRNQTAEADRLRGLITRKRREYEDAQARGDMKAAKGMKARLAALQEELAGLEAGPTRTPQPADPPPVGVVFARRMREMKELRGLSAQGLSDRLAELGLTMSRDAITKMENHPSRAAGIKLETAIAIAAALNVSPLWMIAPEGQGDSVAVAPELSFPAGAVRLWARGDWPLGGEDPEGFFSMMPAHEYEERRKRGISARRHYKPRAGELPDKSLPAPYHYPAEREQQR